MPGRGCARPAKRPSCATGTWPISWPRPAQPNPNCKVQINRPCWTAWKASTTTCAALDYAAATPGRAERGLALAGPLSKFWWTRGYYREARGHLERALAQTPADAVTYARAKSLHGLGNI